MEPTPYTSPEPAYESPRAPTRKERFAALETIPIRLVFGILLLLFGILILIQPEVLPWIIGFTLIGVGIVLLVTWSVEARPRQETRPTPPPPWQP